MSFLPAHGYRPGPFQLGGEHYPAPPAPLQTLPGSGREDPPSSSTCTSPQTALQAENKARLPRIVHAGGFVFYVKMCVSAYFRHHSRNISLRLDHLPGFRKTPVLWKHLFLQGKSLSKAYFQGRRNSVSCCNCGPGQHYWVGFWLLFWWVPSPSLSKNQHFQFFLNIPPSFQVYLSLQWGCVHSWLVHYLSLLFALEGVKAIIQPIFFEIWYVCMFFTLKSRRKDVWIICLKYPIISGYLTPSMLSTKTPIVIFVCIMFFLVSLHLSSGFCGVTFVPWPQGFINCSPNVVPFPLKHQTRPENFFLQSFLNTTGVASMEEPFQIGTNGWMGGSSASSHLFLLPLPRPTPCQPHPIECSLEVQM